MNGIINVYKEKGLTSHDVVARLRKILGIKKIGHTGTLDPQAVGVLPVCIGRAVKIAEYITSDIKEYIAEVTLGVVTTTCDRAGDIVSKSTVDFDITKIKEVVESFVGEQYQTPPMYSAIKVNGVKLYELARNGVEVEREPRKIIIHKIEILELKEPIIKICVLCSKGTYIRSIAYDIGLKLGCGAFLSQLTRTKSACFTIENAVTLDKIQEFYDDSKISDLIIPIDEVLNYPKIFAKEKAYKLLVNGNKMSIDNLYRVNNLKDNEKILIYDHNKKLIGIYQMVGDIIKPLKMLIR